MRPQMQAWHKAPFLRLVPALAAGILLQWYVGLPFRLLLSVFSACGLLTIGYFFLPLHFRYRFTLWQGAILLLAFISLGAVVTWLKNPVNDSEWMGHVYKEGDAVLMKLEEPLTEKPNSYKAEATFQFIIRGDAPKKITGRAILYFKKDTAVQQLGYGSQVIFSRPLQTIKNSGNPGGFDYRRYCLFQGITHQAFLSSKDFRVLAATDKNWFLDFIYTTRGHVRNYLKTHISGPREQGLAEAILIGYKDDLDKNLVQSFSNTGVVHIIAISGLHLGLIYTLLIFFTRPLKKRKTIWLRLVLILSSLWLFSILAGGQPSVLRAALMFSAIALSEVASKKLSVYNTIAASAFVLLCINPFYLWDVGFQLSYAAVLGIVSFYGYFKNLVPSSNKIISFFLKILSVTMAAQVFTLPISIYHFHQTPLLFLISNLVAVPLGSLVLIGEVFLCALAPLPLMAAKAGVVITFLISLLNDFILYVDQFSFSVWNRLSISFPQLLFLLLFSGTACYWLMEKKKKMLWIALFSFSAFLLLRALSFQQAYRQQKLIVYNVPRHSAIDLVYGTTYNFIGDTSLLHNEFLRNFHLQPSRIEHRIGRVEKLNAGARQFRFGKKNICIIDSLLNLSALQVEKTPEVVILSGNPRYNLLQLSEKIRLHQLVLDGSVPLWKSRRWQHEADSLGIRCHNVAEKGAFVLNLH